jgi:hypothetical protein
MKQRPSIAVLCTAAFLAAGLPAPHQAPASQYEVYAPEIAHVTIYDGSLEPGHFGYNHAASVEWFDGRFYAVWMGNPDTWEEPHPNRHVLLSTSADFVHWTHPTNFVADGDPPLPCGPKIRQSQPNLVNVNGRELWCLWLHGSPAGGSGIYCSKLDKTGGRWRNEFVMDKSLIGGAPFSAWVGQNPFVCRSGRVLVPLMRTRKRKDCYDYYFQCLYTDDGKTWMESNPISVPFDRQAQWEPHFYEQADGALRGIMRNWTDANTPIPTKMRLTVTGTGSDTGEPLRFESEPHFFWTETHNDRPQVFRAGTRYCLLQHDARTTTRGHTHRLNLALFFSRTGGDDFVAATPFSFRGHISSYPQGVEHGGRIYIAYSEDTRRPHRGFHRIKGVTIDPAPTADRFYVWPRQRYDLADNRYTARVGIVTNQNRRALLFTDKASAGLDLPIVNFANGETLDIALDVRMAAVQQKGNATICSYGDRIPIRICMPGNRRGELYSAWGPDQWQCLGAFPVGKWNRLRLRFGAQGYAAAIGDGRWQPFAYPLRAMNPRFYLGDGYEIDYTESNTAETRIHIDLDTLRSSVSDRTP